MRKDTRIGLFGFGCVGQGLYDVLSSSKGFQADIVRICVKHRDKPRKLPAEMFCYDRHEILNDPSINLVVELIDTADEAFEIVSEAMRRGKNVVTANKKMVAEHFTELYELQQQYGVSLLYEGSSCGSIPIIRTLEEYYDNELLESVQGIFNGTTNYILTRTVQEGQDYPSVLADAQQLGFAESDPTLDVQGYDALYKLIIVAAHAFGVIVNPYEVFRFGIPKISADDLRIAREKGYRIKLLAKAIKVKQKLAMFVMPQFVDANNLLHTVQYEYNGVLVSGAFSDQQFFQGKGAGSHPTGSAVLSDVSATSYDYKYEYKKKLQNGLLRYSTDFLVDVYLRYRYPADLNQFPFRSIRERHAETESDFNYVIGQIRIADLINIPKLDERDVFLALLPQSQPVAG